MNTSLQPTNVPLVSIVTVNYNGHNDTIALLASLRKQTYRAIEIFVVDNASTNPIDDLLIDYPEVQLIKSEHNLGFAGGNNLAIKRAKGDFILLLNNDTEVATDFLAQLLNEAINNTTIGLVSPKILFFEDKKTIQYAGCTAINPYTSRGFAWGYGEVDHGQHDTAKYTHRAHGAAMLISRAVIDKVGMLPEAYFLYYEEMDYCEAVKRAGFKIWYEAKATVYHKESRTVGKNSDLKIHYMARNRWLFVRRNFSGTTLLISSLYLLLVAYPKELFAYAIQGRWSSIKAMLRGVVWNFVNPAFK